jgi:hypothetical protein
MNWIGLLSVPLFVVKAIAADGVSVASLHNRTSSPATTVFAAFCVVFHASANDSPSLVSSPLVGLT